MRPWLSLTVLALLLLAGCSSGGNGGKGGTSTEDPDRGSIRGVVVDNAIVPILGATVSLSNGLNTTTDKTGAFRFDHLDPGAYFVAAGKAGFKGIQTSVNVVAGESEPDLLKLQLERIAVAQPYLDSFKLDGFYQCAFSFGQEDNPVITDSCDFVYRTAWDGLNESGLTPPVTRNPLNSINTQYLDVSSDTFSIIQEAFWEDENVPVMMVLLSSTPIDNACDCSETDYLDVTMASPTLGRLDRYNLTGEIEAFPDSELVAARAFLDWETPSLAQNLKFQVITTLFHNYVPPTGWTFLTKDNYPVG